MNHRPLRVSKLIQAELNGIVNREIELEPGTLATITGVSVDKKLERAEVLVSVVPFARGEYVLEAFRNAQGKLQYLLMQRVHIKPMPRIEFKLDLGAEQAARVEKLLIESEDKENPAG